MSAPAATELRTTRATFYTTGMEHPPTSATGTGWERTPWHAPSGRRGRRYDKPARSAVMSPSARRTDVVSQDAVLFSFLFGPLRRQSTPNTDEIKECGKSTYENHEHRKHHLLDPPCVLAGNRPGSMGHARCQEARTPVCVTSGAR
jgi:hypothetical protein